MAPGIGEQQRLLLEIPTDDVERSVAFSRGLRMVHQAAVGRTHGVRRHLGEVSGTWVPGRPPSRNPGLLVYVMVDSVEATVEIVVSHGGAIVQPIGGDAPEITARFSDPYGNVLGLYQEPAG